MIVVVCSVCLLSVVLCCREVLHAILYQRPSLHQYISRVNLLLFMSLNFDQQLCEVAEGRSGFFKIQIEC